MLDHHLPLRNTVYKMWLAIGCLFLLTRIPALGQENQIRLLTKSDGLPCSEVVKVFLSQDGLLYGVCTNSAVFRYDGVQFQELDELYELNRATTPVIYEDKHGIWLDYRNNIVLIDHRQNHKVFKIQSEYKSISTTNGQSFEYLDGNMRIFRFNRDSFREIEGEAPFANIANFEQIKSIKKNSDEKYQVHFNDGEENHIYTIDEEGQVNSSDMYLIDLGDSIKWKIGANTFFSFPNRNLDYESSSMSNEWHPAKFNRIIYKEGTYYGVIISQLSDGREFSINVFIYSK